MALDKNIKIYSSTDFPSYLPKLNDLYEGLFSGGKGFRAKMIQMMSQGLLLPAQTELLLAQTIEFIHNASLLHDDLVDRSSLRRGKTTAWLKYTPEYAVLAGDYLLARVMVNLSSFGNIKLVHYTAQMISDLLEGEWLQDSIVGDFLVELSQLDRVHNLKTSSLFKWCLRAPFIAKEIEHSQLHTTLDQMGTLLGQLFQRSDDLLDFDIRNFEGKALLGDLKSGYFNSFCVFAIQDLSFEEKKNLKNIQSLQEFKNKIGGDIIFEQKLKEFDQKNIYLIELYQHHLYTLKTFLSEEQQSIIPFLAPLTDLLYWRKK